MTLERHRALRDEIVAQADHVGFWWFVAAARQELGCGHEVEQGERFVEIVFGVPPGAVRAVVVCARCWAGLLATLPKPAP